MYIPGWRGGLTSYCRLRRTFCSVVEMVVTIFGAGVTPASTPTINNQVKLCLCFIFMFKQHLPPFYFWVDALEVKLW